MVGEHTWKATRMSRESPQNFIRPSEGFIKLNFDGDSKGNPGIAGIGGIFRDCQGRVRLLYLAYGGMMSNNEAEPMAVRQGMRIAVRLRYKQLEVEGDSLLVINMMRKLYNGKAWDKLTHSWRIASLIQELGEIIKRFDYMIIKHVKREGNKADDFLAN